MTRSIFLSLVFHSAMIVLTAISLPFMLRAPVELPPILSVELIQITDKTSIPFAAKAAKTLEKIKKKDILMKELNHYDEIILVGSGKGVVSVKSVERINWKRKSIRIYKIILKTFLKEIKKQKYLYK